ncbi:MAG: hypothetical protein K6E91_03880, partial [Butyrivibrio sp.]|nr:hypothetical protein [Butyrivibrio sp.]
MLYKLPVDSTFGTFTVYDAIAIGESAYTLAFAFPNIQETTDPYIDHYKFDELKKYNTVYLSGFYYDDKEKAEKLVTDLSENGVRIVILADGMPEDRSTRTRNFLGVTCNIIQFENGYPILYTEDYGEMDCDLFPSGYSKWITCYLNGLKDAKGTIFDNDVELAFYGTGINENVCFLSLNLPFYYYLTQDMNAEKIIQWIMGMDPGQLPEKHIYPIDIKYSSNGIVIHNYVDLILKTGIAFHDNFRSGQKIYSDNHILAVGEGDTKISFVYPYFWQGLLTSLTGILLTVLFLVYVAKAYRRDEYLRERGLYGPVHIGILDTFRGTGIEKINKASAVDTTEKTTEEISLSEEPQIEVHASDSEGLSDEIIETGATEDNIPVATEDNIPVTTEDNKSVTTEDNRSIASEDNRTEPKIINDIKYEVESGNIEEVISDSYAELELNQKKYKISDSMRNVENLWEFDMPLINGDDFDIVKTKRTGESTRKLK